MTSTVQTFRSTTPTAKPLVSTRQPGELWVNFPDKQLGLIDASQTAQPLIAVRFFSAATSYVSGDIVTQGASLWIAKGSVPAGAFAAAQWNQVATYTGGTFASLILNGPAGTNRSLFSQTAGVNRWELQLAGLTSESGSNAGSDFSIYRYNDAGAVIDAPFAITRSTGRATFSLDPFGPSGGYLPLIGGTLSGNLSITRAGSATLALTASGSGNGAVFSINTGTGGASAFLHATKNGSPRWDMALIDGSTEGGANAGSNLTLTRYDDTGAFVGVPFSISRASGTATFTSVNSLSTGATVVLDGAGSHRAIVGATNGLARWRLVLGHNLAESGANTGSDFYLQRYDDTGAVIDNPLMINRASGAWTINTLASGQGGSSIWLNCAPGAGTTRSIAASTNGLLRWRLSLGNSPAETGANAGSDYYLQRYDDTGALIDTVMNSARANGVMSFSKAIVNGPSDRRLKENIAPIEGALDKVNALQGMSFNMLATPNKREIGLIAQDVEPVVPEIMQSFTTADDEGKTTGEYLALDYPKLTALLIEAVKTLTARVADLEAKAG